MIKRFSPRLALLVAFETMLIVLAVAAAAYARLDAKDWALFLHQGGVLKSLLLAGITQACLYYADLYDLKKVSDTRELIIRILQALGWAAIILAGVYTWFPDAMIGRLVFMFATFIVITLVIGWRLLLGWMGRQMAPRERLLLVGTNAAAVSLARELHERRNELGISIVGFVDPDRSMVGQSLINPGVIGTLEDIPSIVASHHVDRVVVSLADARGKLPMDKLLEMRFSSGVT